jgi:integration host factor subunit alpha
VARDPWRKVFGVMTRVDLIETLTVKIDGLNARQARALLDNVLETIKHALESGETIKIPGFGNFVPQERSSRPGRNPATGEQITLPARRVVTFKASRKLKEALNS